MDAMTPAKARRSSTPRRRPPARPREPRRGLGFYGYSVRDVMTRQVIAVDPDASLATAAGLMSRHRVSGLPVVGRSRRIVGVLSQKDVTRRLHDAAGLRLPGGVFDLILASGPDAREGLAEESRRLLDRTKVRVAMTRRPITIGPDATLDEAVRALIANRINRLPVVEGGFVVGIVTRHDLLSGLTPEEPVAT